MLFPDVNEQLELSFFVCVTSTLRSSSICIHSFRKKVFPSTAFKTYVQFKQTILYITRSNSELQIEAFSAPEFLMSITFHIGLTKIIYD
jgi:hypothetical protein